MSRKPTSDQPLVRPPFTLHPEDIAAFSQEADRRGVSRADLFNQLISRANLTERRRFVAR